MKNGLFKKSMSVVLAMLMLLTCWVWVAPTEAEAVAASTVKSTNEAALATLTGSTDINTTSGVYFAGDTEKGITSVPNVYQNLIWSGSAQQAAIITNQSIQDSNDVEQFAIYYPTTVLMYDGSTTPQMGVSILKDSLNKSDSKYQVFHYGTKISSTTDLVIPGDWHTKNEETGSTNPKFYYTWNGGNNQAGLNYTGTKGSSYYAGGTGWHYMSNLIQYNNDKGTLSDNTYSATYTPSFQTYLGRQWTQVLRPKSKEATYTLNCSVPIYVINAKPLKAAYTKVDEYKKAIDENPHIYDVASVKKFVELANALMATNPNKYDWKTNTATQVSNYASAAKTAVTNWNTWVNGGGLKKQQYAVMFDNMFNFNDFNISGSLTVNNRTDTGFKVTSTAADGNTGFSDYIAVEPGKTYVFSADVEFTQSSGGYDMYVHTVNANKEGVQDSVVDTSNGAHPESPVYYSITGQTTNKTPYIRFTAGDNTHYIRIRFDANAVGNELTVNNIRVCEDLGTSYVASKTYDYDTALGTLPTPTRTGYTFAGWVDANGSAVNSSTTVTDDTFLYSKWTVNQYTITFDTDGGSTIAPITQDYGSTITAPDEPTKSGYKFIGWDKEIPETMPAEDLTINAIWEVDTATVTFANEDGTTIKSTTLNVGAAVTAPANPSKDATEENHYTFIGWKSSVDNNVYAADEIPAVSGAVTYTAQFEATGHSYTSEVTKEATCTEKGVETYTCACGDTYTKEIDALNHDYKSVVTAPTCTAEGYTTHTCTRCNDSYTDSKVAATGHTYSKVVTAPTCTAEGYTTHTCSVCGHSYVDTYVDATGHSYTSEVTKEATCTEKGVETYTCACGDTYTKEIDALNHDYKSVVTAPTCTAEGYTTHTCTRCNDSYTDSKVAATGHTYSKVVTAPTCTAEGYTTYTCACGDSYVSDKVPATGHSYTSEVTKEATCTEKGIKTYTCACGDTYTEEIDALNHNYESVVTAPTCTAEGYTTHTCTRCNDSYTDSTVAATGHAWNDGEITTKPTCNDAGVKTFTCDTCGATKTEAVGATGHKAKEAVTENNVDATCLTDGSYDTVVYCVTCNAEISREKTTVPATGHSFGAITEANDATCTAAGNKAYKKCKSCSKYFADDADNKSEYGVANAESFVIPALEHDFAEDFTVDKKASCTQAGSKSKHCSRCEATTDVTEIPVREHHLVDNGVAVEATCETAGTMNQKCKNAENAEYEACSHESTRVIEKLKHSYTGVYKFVVETKTHSQMCVNGCNEYGNETACTFDAVVTAPDCFNKGYTTYTCTVCTGYYKSDETTRDHIYVYTAGNGTEHSVSCQHEGCSYNDTELCSGGTATCTDKAICEKCKTAWGEKDAEKHTGAADVIKNYKKATCSEEGYTGDVYWSCCDALETKGKVDDKLAHTEVEIPAVAPTCTATGLTAGVKCSVCEEILTEQETVDSLGHKYEGKVTKGATCTEAGVMTYTCENDASHTYTEEIKAKGHILTQVEAKAPTCTEAGYEAYEYCSACDYTTFKEVVATGHKYTESVTKESTCTDKGEKTFTCSCGDTYTEEIAAKGHTLTQVEAKAPTCTEAGYEAYEYCSACDYTTFKAVDATGHTEVEIPAVEATCKKTGLTAGVKCSVCKEVLVAQEVVEKAAHKEVTVGNVPASCINNGRTGKVECEVCGTTIKEDETIPKIPHEFKVYPEYVIDATCTSGKISVYKCKFCTETKSVEETDSNGNPINLKPHVIIELEKKDPTCEEAGYYTTICITCDAMVKTEVIPALGHADKDGDGVCDNCNGTYVESENGSKVCGCICHKESGIMKLLYKIIRFFWKLFGIGKSCACGTVHY